MGTPPQYLAPEQFARSDIFFAPPDPTDGAQPAATAPHAPAPTSEPGLLLDADPDDPSIFGSGG